MNHKSQKILNQINLTFPSYFPNTVGRSLAGPFDAGRRVYFTQLGIDMARPKKRYTHQPHGLFRKTYISNVSDNGAPHRANQCQLQ